VVFDRFFGEDHPLGDLPVAVPLGQPVEDLHLPGGQVQQEIPLLPATVEAGQQLPRNVRIHVGLAPRDGSDRRKQLDQPGGLEDVSVDPDGGERRQMIFVVEGGDGHELEVPGPRVRQLLDQLDPVHGGHVYVEQQHVRRGLPDDLQSLRPVPALADHLDVRLHVQQALQPLPEKPVIVRQHHPNPPHSPTSPRGTVQVTVVPRPRTLSIRSVPPQRRTRSSMFANP